MAKKEFNLDTKVTVRNLADCTVGFARQETLGEVNIVPKGVTKLTRSEIITQVQNGNKLLGGTDEHGSHATLYVEDAPTRQYLEFDDAESGRKQRIYNEEAVKEVFDADVNFEEKLKDLIVTYDEKCMLMPTLKKLRVNDYTKIKIAERHTGHKYEF